MAGGILRGGAHIDDNGAGFEAYGLGGRGTGANANGDAKNQGKCGEELFHNETFPG
jgi:hypothetical protein